jgi:hypothetical protein
MMTDITDDYDRLRSLYYLNSDLFLFTIATDHPTSVEDAEYFFEHHVCDFPGKRILVCLNDHCREQPQVIKNLPGHWKEEGPFELVEEKEARRLVQLTNSLAYLKCPGTSSADDIKSMLMEVSQALLKPRLWLKAVKFPISRRKSKGRIY